VNYMVIWGNSQYGSWPNQDAGILGSRVTPEGVILDPEGISISTAQGIKGEPHIVYDGTNYFVVWQDGRRDPTAFQPILDIVGTRIQPNGTLLDGPPDTGGILINKAPFHKGIPRVSFDGGGYIVVWGLEGYGMYPPAGIFGAIISKDGLLLSGSPDDPGVSLSDPTPYMDMFFTPNIIFSGKANLLTWVSVEQDRTIRGALIFPE
jgi:hypothetical protein